MKILFNTGKTLRVSQDVANKVANTLADNPNSGAMLIEQTPDGKDVIHLIALANVIAIY